MVEREHAAEGTDIRVEADATLIDNAKKHGGGVEALKVKRENGHIAFEMEDHGPHPWRRRAVRGERRSAAAVT